MSEPRLRLDLGDALRREALRRAVVDGAERDAVVVDREQRVAQREDLEAARVGEDRPVPAHERVQAAELRDHAPRPGRKCRWYVLPRMIAAPSARSSSGCERLDGRLRADRHEHRRRDVAVRGVQRRRRARRRPSRSSVERTRQSHRIEHRVAERVEAVALVDREPVERRASASTPANAITSASSVERGRWKFVSSASTRAELEARA